MRLALVGTVTQSPRRQRPRMVAIHLPALSESTTTARIQNVQLAELTLWIERLRHIRQAILDGTEPLSVIQVALDAAVAERGKLTS